VERVIVNGETVVLDGQLTRVDERQVLDEVRARYPEYLAVQERMEAAGRELEPYVARMYRRCAEQDVPARRVLQP
jgi:hypothetical protein